jgi:hypothetical protein
MANLRIEDGYTMHRVNFQTEYKGVPIKVFFTQKVSQLTICGHYHLVIMDMEDNILTSTFSTCGAPVMKSSQDVKDMVLNQFRFGISSMEIVDTES